MTIQRETWFLQLRARRFRLRLERAPSQRRGVNSCGGYRLSDSEGNAVLGEEFDASAEDVEDYLTRRALEPPRRNGERLSP